MVLVSRMPSNFAKSVCAAWLLSCEASAPPASASASAVSGTTPNAEAARTAHLPQATSVAAPTVSASSSAVAAPAPRAPELEYPPLDKPLAEPCADPRAVLAVRKNHDRSGRLAVQQALVANPEFKVVSEKAQAAFELDFYETIYGTKNFARRYPGDPMFSEAVIARCADVRTCNGVASMFHAAFPAERIELVCGIPPKTTGGFSRVRELSIERLVVPDEKAPAGAHCARVQACLARERSPVRLKPECAELKKAKLVACAEQPNCSRVAACIAEELR